LSVSVIATRTTQLWLIVVITATAKAGYYRSRRMIRIISTAEAASGHLPNDRLLGALGSRVILRMKS